MNFLLPIPSSHIACIHRHYKATVATLMDIASLTRWAEPTVSTLSLCAFGRETVFGMWIGRAVASVDIEAVRDALLERILGSPIARAFRSYSSRRYFRLAHEPPPKHPASSLCRLSARAAHRVPHIDSLSPLQHEDVVAPTDTDGATERAPSARQSRLRWSVRLLARMARTS